MKKAIVAVAGLVGAGMGYERVKTGKWVWPWQWFRAAPTTVVPGPGPGQPPVVNPPANNNPPAQPPSPAVPPPAALPASSSSSSSGQNINLGPLAQGAAGFTQGATGTSGDMSNSQPSGGDGTTGLAALASGVDTSNEVASALDALSLL